MNVYKYIDILSDDTTTTIVIINKYWFYTITHLTFVNSFKHFNVQHVQTFNNQDLMIN